MKAALHNIMNAENRDAADLAIDQFEASYGAKYAKAVDKVLKDRDVLLTHFEFPAEHWIHLRTTDEIVKPLFGARLRGYSRILRFSGVDQAPARRGVSAVASILR